MKRFILCLSSILLLCTMTTVSAREKWREFTFKEARVSQGILGVSLFDEVRNAHYGAPVERFGLRRKHVEKIEKKGFRVFCWYPRHVRHHPPYAWPQCWVRPPKKPAHASPRALSFQRTSHPFAFTAA